MKLREITAEIQRIVPLDLAQSWDNVGLLLGDPNQSVNSILITIDITKEVLAEARKQKANLIVSYHPPIWEGIKKITAEQPNALIYELIRSGVAVFSPHTALDAASGGINDALAEMVGIKEAEPIGDYVEDGAAEIYKLVVFVPQKSAAKVANAIFAAGAGAIGNYTNCGFQAVGTGTFLPLDRAKPAIGKRGKLEKVEEVRFETIVPAGKLDVCIVAMRKAHPYEEPAFDVLRLYNPQTRFGLGRIGNLEKPTRLATIIQKIKKTTSAKAIGFVGPRSRLVKKAAVCAGSCGKIINQVIAQNAELYVTGELKHHHALAAQEAGLSCICLSHTVSERFFLKKFAKQLKKQIKNIKIAVSKSDADPFVWKEL